MDNVSFDDLKKKVGTYIHNPNDLKRIEDAYLFAKGQHEGQMRKSGDPYITHPLHVALILAELHVGPDTIIAGLLHDVVEDTNTKLEDIAKRFGEDVAGMVDGVTKLTQMKFTSLEEKQAENHQKMLLAMGKDIRVIVVKLADRLHNIRTIDAQKPEKRERICKETLEIYAPLAHRLGMFKIKAELEDRSLRYTDPVMFKKIEEDISATNSARIENIDHIIEEIKKYLKEENVIDFDIKGRVKNIYSIYKKMINQHKEFEDIYDVLAIRIIVDTIDNCYRVLGLIHAKYTPVPKRFKDYIAVPKPNMYQSLHTTVISSDGLTFEVQIRTKEMDEVAELGIAAHWAYKENVIYSKEKEQFEIASKLKWYAELLKFNEEDKEDSDPKTFVDSIRKDILTTSVYVYTPTGDVIDLPKGATPLDLAYKIHTELGNTMIGALVNKRIVPLDYELQNGDIVSIRTNKNSQGPTASWLKIAKTTHARHKIKTFLNKQNKDILLESGKRQLEEEFQLQKIYSYDLKDDFVSKTFGRNNINTVDELYIEIGKGTLSEKTVVSKYLGEVKKDQESIIQQSIAKFNKNQKHISETGVIVDGLSNPQIKLGVCCNPLPGDPIVGYVTKGSGIVVHHKDCKNIISLPKERLINLMWDLNIQRKYPVSLKITANNNMSLLGDVMSILSSFNINVSSLNVKNNIRTLETIIKIKIIVSSLADLNNVIVNLNKISAIHEITREGL